MDKAGGNRIQIRVQEWARELHPDALRNRLRNFRRYVISASTEKRHSTSNTRSEACVSTMDAELRESCDISVNSSIQNEMSDDKKFLSHQPEESKSTVDVNADLDNIRIPDVVVQPNNSFQNYDLHSNFNNNTNKNLQLTVGIDSTPRNKSPITVQEWVDSLPLTPTESSREECEIPDKNVVPLGDCDTDNLTLGAEAGCLVEKKTAETAPPPPPVNVTITGCPEPSEVESHCSSVDSLLEARKPDPEEVLLSLGFGGTASSSYLETGRIPKRFLQQSQLKGVDIEEFIRQQQDLIYTFESGYYGYRGLAGPSHSNPSVIVAKILEKLREHERETASMTSYQLDFRKRCSLEKNPENPVTNKFSKVARNVLTKIRCTPSSVLSPDNRRWLDSQGSKSPEIARRLIIGQKSFTFGRDGDLIEASNINNKDQVNSKNNSHEALLQESNEQQREHYNEVADYVFANCSNLGRRFTDSSTDMSIESIIMKNEFSRQSSSNDKKVFSDSFDDHRSVREETRDNRNSTLKRLNHIDVDEPISLDLHSSPFNTEEENCHSKTYSEQLCARINRVADFTSPYETSDNVRKTACSVTQCASSSKEMSLKEELRHSGIPLADLSTNHGSFKKFNNILTRYSSFEESLKGSSDDEMTNVLEGGSVDDCRNSEKADYYADSATESEFASYPHRSITNKAIHRQYEELILLESILHSIGRPVNVRVVTKDEFSAVSSEQRCSIQTQIIRDALKAYLNQMTEDEIHSELKNCLKIEVQKVADLLDNRCEASKLAVVVKQMTLLLQHQSQLSAQIKELSVVDRKPTSCHEMCDQILKRVHDLELLVQQNAQELAQMKNQLSKKDDF